MAVAGPRKVLFWSTQFNLFAWSLLVVWSCLAHHQKSCRCLLQLCVCHHHRNRLITKRTNMLKKNRHSIMYTHLWTIPLQHECTIIWTLSIVQWHWIAFTIIYSCLHETFTWLKFHWNHLLFVYVVSNVFRFFISLILERSIHACDPWITMCQKK